VQTHPMVIVLLLLYVYLLIICIIQYIIDYFILSLGYISNCSYWELKESVIIKQIHPHVLWNPYEKRNYLRQAIMNFSTMLCQCLHIIWLQKTHMCMSQTRSFYACSLTDLFYICNRTAQTFFKTSYVQHTKKEGKQIMGDYRWKLA